MSTTATLDLRDAIAAAIREAVNPPMGPNGPVLGSPRFYRGSAPADAALGYVLIGNADEGQGGFYGQPGQDGTIRLHAWARTQDDALRLYGWLLGLLHERPLNVTEHQLVSGRLRLIQTVADADGKAWQAAADYTTATLDA